MTAKEIWYVWDGNTERDMSFRKYVTAIMYGDGVIGKRKDLVMIMYGESFFWNIGINKRTTIVAYTLGETRERVQCYACEGGGFLFIPVLWSGDDLKEKCPDCQGRGYTWKMGEKK